MVLYAVIAHRLFGFNKAGWLSHPAFFLSSSAIAKDLYTLSKSRQEQDKILHFVQNDEVKGINRA